MRRSLAVAAAVILSFAFGFFGSRTTGAPHGQTADSTIDIPAAALKTWYPPVSEFENGGEPLEDERFDGLMVRFENAMTEEATLADVERSIEPVVQGFLRRISIPALSEQQKEQATGYLQELAALDAMLALPEAVEDFERETGYVFRDFTARLRRGQISDEQTARIFAHMAEMMDERRHYIEYLIPGRVAQHITGKDTDGVEFALEDYRGNIVVLVFSGQWCGPCRVEYPYHRFVLEHFRDDPVLLLGVNSDADIETIRVRRPEVRPHRTAPGGTATVSRMPIRLQRTARSRTPGACGDGRPSSSSIRRA